MKRSKLTLLAAPALLLIVAACGTPATPTPDGGGGGGGTEATATPGGGGGGGGDAEAAFEVLTPPNAEEVTKTTSGGVIFAAFNTPDSIDSLTSFYEDAFNELGLQILTTTETSGGVTWLVGTDENATEFGGVVSVIPTPDGGSGSTVSIQIGATNQ